MATDDGGMLINFDLTETTYRSKPSFRGGSWRDKRSARKAFDFGKARATKSSESQSKDIGHEPTVKRVKTTHDKVRSRPSTTADIRLKDSKGDKSNQVISSLFTYNPSTTTTVLPQQQSNDEQSKFSPSNAPLSAEHDFNILGISPALTSHMAQKLNISAPTSIQKITIPKLLRENTDAFVQAQTGSGKTLAYLLPILQRIMSIGSSANLKTNGETSSTHIDRSSGLFALILSPTRELASQILRVLETLLRCHAAHHLVSGIVLGGEKKKSEKARLRKGVNILIATPGRLADHLQHTEALDVREVRWLVLDEGDRLMELGFEEDLKRILDVLNERWKGRRRENEGQNPGQLPTRRINILCSATMKTEVMKLGELSLQDAVHLSSQETGQDLANEKQSSAENNKNELFLAPAQLQQSYAVVPAKQRLVTLASLLKRTFDRRGSVMKAIVFMSCADVVDYHFDVFTASPSASASEDDKDEESVGEVFAPETTSLASPHLASANNPSIKVYRLHGSLPQHLRTSTLGGFRTEKDPAVLFCTDVASRGLDLPDIDFVLEYDPPFAAADHLHRIGRTARAGKTGRAMIFLMPGTEEGYVDILKGQLASALDEDAPRPSIGRHTAEDLLARGFSASNQPTTKSSLQLQKWQEKASTWQLEVERQVLASKAKHELARKAFQAHVRAYSTHTAAERKYFDITQLHLGHLAKAFGLRDKPSEVNIPGRAKSKTGGYRPRTDQHQMVGSTKSTDGPDGTTAVVDADLNRRKMRGMAKMLGTGSSEFNLG